MLELLRLVHRRKVILLSLVTMRRRHGDHRRMMSLQLTTHMLALSEKRLRTCVGAAQRHRHQALIATRHRPHRPRRTRALPVTTQLLMVIPQIPTAVDHGSGAASVLC